MSATPRDNSVQSVDRAVSILQVLARSGLVSVTALAEELALHKSTVSRLLGTLQARGLVEHLPGRGGYRLDHGITLLAQGVSNQPDLRAASRPVCTEVAEETGETINIVVREGHRVVTIDQVIGPAAVTTVNWVGRHHHLHSSAAGKLFLAGFSESDLRQYLAEGLSSFTEHTITEPEPLRADLARVAERGYGWTVEESEIGLVAVAAPIRAGGGEAVAAISLSGPIFRLPESRIPAVASRLQEAASRISYLNGLPKTG